MIIWLYLFGAIFAASNFVAACELAAHDSSFLLPLLLWTAVMAWLTGKIRALMQDPPSQGPGPPAYS